jgi:predicted DNA-binding transcriptional regulator AlpA
MAHLNVTVRLDDRDRIQIAEEVAECIRRAMVPVVERMVRDLRKSNSIASGGIEEGEVRYLTRKQVAKAFGISTRSVDRYEELGKIPRRRQLGSRTIRWLEHEVREAALCVPAGEGDPPKKGGKS